MAQAEVYTAASWLETTAAILGVGWCLAVLLLVVSLIPIVTYLVRTFRRAD